MTKHSDEELKLLKRRNTENWLAMNAKWLPKLRKGTKSSAIIRDEQTGKIRSRLDAGVDYGLLVRSGNYSGCRWTLTPYAEMLLEEMEK